MYKIKIYVIVLFITLGFTVFKAAAQTAIIKGSVINIQTGEKLSYASIQSNKTNITTADSLGQYIFSVQPGRIVLKVTQIGYVPYEQDIHIGFEENLTINIELTPKENELDRVVVSGSRQEMKIAREVMSVTSIKPYLITNTNANTLSDVLNKVTGVSVIEGQAIIRGGTGWSYNVGSRVMVLLDDMPLMGADVGDVQWDLLPIEAAENIEVIKGPSSVLYGSSASAGTVNVRTGWPTNKPETKITFYQGIQDNPKNNNSIWWERTSQPFNTGSFFVHKQKFGQFDLELSGNINANRSHIQYNDDYRLRTYVKTRYRFENIKGLSTGINATYMAKKGGRFFLWKDADSGSLVPFDGSIGYDKYKIYTIDPHLTFIQNTYTISVKYRFYNIIRDGVFGAIDTNNTNNAVAKMNAVDVSFQKKLSKYFTNTSGIYTTNFNAVGNVYPGKQKGYSGAAYTQLEFFKGRWNATTGLRYEVNAVANIEQTQRPLFRLGLNYKATSKTFLRASFGEGFRFPTIVERFVEDNAAGVNIYPNPGLKTERGWYTEIGVKQGFNIAGFSATFDACVFWMEYTNLIELRFNQYEKASYYIDTVNFKLILIGEDKIGFKALNLPKSRTAGYEFSLEGQGNIGQIGIRTISGFTYTYPIDLNADTSLQNVGNYIKAFVNNHRFIDATNPAFNSLVAYRNRYVVKVDLECSYKRIGVGYSINYLSIQEKIDNNLYNAIPGLKTFQQDAGHGAWVHNMRVSAKLTPHLVLAFLVNNLANNTYASRPARIEPMRSYSIQLRVAF
jgi:iron complex outermembrane receptor protein